MRYIILASHGELARGMLNSIKMIVGDNNDAIETFCLYPGDSPMDYAKIQMERIQNSKDEFIFITDIRGGSVHTALMELLRYRNVSLFSGMNMNLILEIMLSTDIFHDERLHQFVQDARKGITLMRYGVDQFIEDDEF